MKERDKKVKAAVKQLNSNPLMRGKNPEEIVKIAKESVEKKSTKNSIGFDFNTLFKKRDDVTLATNLLNKYLEDFTVETQADKNALSQLIQLEVWHRRFSEKIEDALHTNGRTPKELLTTVHKNLDQIRQLKSELGLGAKDQGTVWTYINQLIKRGNIWSEKLNKGDRTFFCQHCSKPNLLVFKVDEYDPIKHPFFQGRYVTNPKIIKLYMDGRLTEEEVGEIFDTAKRDYVQWLIKKFYNKDSLKRIQKSQEEHYNKSFGKDRIPDETNKDT